MIWILFLCSILTATLSGIVGMAGGVTLLAIMTFFFPLSIVIPVHGIIQLSSNSFRTFLLRQNIKKKPFYFFCLGAPFGAFCSYFLVKNISFEFWALLIISGLITYTIFKPRKFPELKLKEEYFFFLGGTTAFLAVLIGATGPLLAPFFLRNDFSKEQTVATKASCQSVTHILKIPVFVALGFDYIKYGEVIVLMLVGTFLGTYLGVKILKEIKTKFFVILYKSLLFLILLRLLKLCALHLQ